MEQQGNHFWKGVLAGVVVSLVIAAVSIWGITTFLSASRTGSNGQTEENAGLDYQEIESKLNILQGQLNQTFLYDMDEEAMKDGIYKGYVSSLGDPYTVYYTAEEYKKLMESTSGAYVGIGIQFSQDPATGLCTVLRVFRGSGAEEAGMAADDVLSKVDGTDITGETNSDNIVSKIRGKEGTTVEIEVYRPSIKDYITMEVERRSVQMDTVEWKLLENQTGYIQITEFDSVTYDQFSEALADLKSQGMTSLILDLRNNPGGLLDQAVKIADDFISGGTIVSTRDKNDREVVSSANSDVAYEGPMAVLVNGNSASASEVVTGALKDDGLATIIGTTTFGKGIVQNIIPFTDGTAMKITSANYYTPNGTCIHGIGITPDVEIEAESGETDSQLEKALEVLGQQ